MLTAGSRGRFEWLVTDHDGDLLKVCPEVVLGKYVALTSIDSGPLILTQKETAEGWQSRCKIAYSPKIADVKAIPRERYDEWYVFVDPVDLGMNHLAENVFEVPKGPGHVSVFVNYGGFALHRAEMKNLADLFWEQLECIRPESYIADGDFLNFVTSNKAFFETVHESLK